MRPSTIHQGKPNIIDKDICSKVTVTSETFSV